MFSDNLKEDLYHCLKCGLCQQACPTFRAMRQEYFAPRGRVQLIKHYIEGDLRITPEFERAVRSCILCDACAAACPSGVRIDHVFRLMRGEITDTVGLGLGKKALFAALLDLSLMRRASGIARAAQKLVIDVLKVSGKLGNIPYGRLPRLNRGSFRQRMGERFTPGGKPIGRVLYFTGCATDMVYDDVGSAVLEVLRSLGIEVVIPQDQVCCGAPIFLTGSTRKALGNIRKNLDILSRTDADAIVVDCATCGAALKKEIPRLLEDLGEDIEKARQVAGKVKDVSEVVSEHMERLEIIEPASSDTVIVTYHDPCHLVRGMGVTAEPRNLLKILGSVKFTEMEGSAECCGGGGSYQFENVEVSAGITARKTENILASGADVVATGCPGCRLTMAGNLPDDCNTEVVHTMQILARFLRKAMD